MGAFLKVIGSGNKPCPEPYERLWADFSRRPQSIRTGDHLVLYAAGGRKRVFALAEITSDVYPANYEDQFPYRVDINYLVNVSPADGVHMDEVSTAKRDLLKSVRQQTYISLTPEEYERAATKLYEAERALKQSSFE
ncbi:MAG: EVE domain-containing protein [Acidobacteria bacterium]|nr:EVE domain-containing protein [Acidobacteriota bacterium]